MKKRKFADGGETIDYIETPSQKATKERMLALANDPDAIGETNPKYNIDEFTAFNQEKPPRDPFAKIPLELKAKPKVVTLAQLQAFKKQYGADKVLRDYMNAKQGLTRKASPRAPMSAEDMTVEKYTPRDMAKNTERVERESIADAIAMKYRSRRSPPASQYAKGGSIDGIAQRGKTRGRMC